MALKVPAWVCTGVHRTLGATYGSEKVSSVGDQGVIGDRWSWRIRLGSPESTVLTASLSMIPEFLSI